MPIFDRLLSLNMVLDVEVLLFVTSSHFPKLMLIVDYCQNP
jgi:hypothetical protein